MSTYPSDHCYRRGGVIRVYCRCQPSAIYRPKLCHDAISSRSHLPYRDPSANDRRVCPSESHASTHRGGSCDRRANRDRGRTSPSSPNHCAIHGAHLRDVRGDYRVFLST